MRRLFQWLVPTAPEAIRVEVERRQLASVQQHVPMIYVIATLNLFIVMAVCAHNDIDPRYWVWMSGLGVLAIVRTVMWLRRERTVLPPERVSITLKRSALIAFVSLLGMGAFTAITFVTGAFARSTLIPISLAFGSMSIAHCFATLRPSAVSAIALGIVPTSVVLIAVGAFDAQVLGFSMLSVAVLMIRFVAVQFDHLVTELQLKHEVYELAHTDALTNLRNRRALVELIEKNLVAGTPFAVALLDLDGFKEVNDRLGHPIGDELLRVVGKRLAASCGTSGTVGRLGGDEFMVVLDAGRGESELRERITTLLDTLCQPTELAGESVMVQASLGHSLFPRDGTTTATLLAAADAALYTNKRERKGSATEAEAEASASANRRRHRTS